MKWYSRKGLDWLPKITPRTQVLTSVKKFISKVIHYYFLTFLMHLF